MQPGRHRLNGRLRGPKEKFPSVVVVLGRNSGIDKHAGKRKRARKHNFICRGRCHLLQLTLELIYVPYARQATAKTIEKPAEMVAC